MSSSQEGFRLHKNNTVTKPGYACIEKEEGFRLHKNNTVTKLVSLIRL